VYELENYLLMVATDRISAFDCIMPEPVPGKGKILTAISKFWFDKTTDIVENHLISTDVEHFPEECQPYAAELEGRSMLVKKTEPLPIECVVRGYLAGSGWKEYQTNGRFCGVLLPQGLRQAEQLPQPIFTPASKEESGHDDNISFDDITQLIEPDFSTDPR